MQALRAAPAAGVAASASTSGRLAAPPAARRRAPAPAPARPPTTAARATQAERAREAAADGGKTVLVKTAAPGEQMPFPWGEKDPYRLPVSIERIKRLLLGNGWEKPWVDQIVDRVMKGTLKTTEERAKGVVDYLASVGLRQDEICNMACISVVLLGLNPETRLAPMVAYLQRRGVSRECVPDLLLAHPRVFEYRVSADESAAAVSKGAARIQVDAVPEAVMAAARGAGGGGKRGAAQAAAAAAMATVAAGGGAGERPSIAVNYFREGASFLASPVSPAPPMPSMPTMVAAAAAAAATAATPSA